MAWGTGTARGRHFKEPKARWGFVNSRERFLNCMHFRPVDRVPYWWFGAWASTIMRWHNEGLPRDVYLGRYFGFDRHETLPVKFGMLPAFDKVLLAEDNRSRTIIDERGVKIRELKEKTETSMPQFLDFPVKTRDDFLRVRTRYNARSETRLSMWWADDIDCWRIRNYPLGLQGGRDLGFLGPIRGWTGLKRLMILLHTDPGLVHEMMDFLADYYADLVSRILMDVEIDYFVFWEDMAYRTGPLISPKLFEEFMVPRYRKVTQILGDEGVDIVMVDSDGDINDLIPLWLDAGVNTFYPLEVQAGMDPVALRKKFGRRIRLLGGIDKRVLARSKEAIEDEFMSKVPYLSKKGGYIPMPDHSVPPDVPLENFEYYIHLLREERE